MSTFTGFDGPLDTRYDAAASKALGADHWRVLTSFKFYIDGDGSNRYIYVERGSLTDGASVPQLFWNMIPPWGDYGQAAVGHDRLCEYLQMVQDGKDIKISRKQADDALLEMMEVLEVPVWKRNVIYAAVRMYAITMRVNKPSTTLLKQKLEADWRLANPEPVRQTA